MAVLNTANRIYSSGKLVYRIFLNTVLVYIDNFQVFKKRVLDDGGIFKETPIVFNDEKLLLTPNAYKTGKIYSALTHDGSGDFTFSRNSSGTYIEDGIIKTALPNVPRFQDGKILIDPQSTNMINRSEDFTKWQRVNSTVDESNIVAPDGIGFFYTVTNINNATANSYIRFNISGADALIVTFSIFVKVGTIDMHCSLNIGGSLQSQAWYDLETGTVGDITVNPSNILDRSIIALGNGIFRVSLTGFTSEGGGTTAFILRTSPSANDPFTRHPTDGATIHCWGGQVEFHNKPTSYIPTNGSVVTRLADVATVTPPTGVNEIIEIIDGVESGTLIIPSTYQLPIGNIDNVKMRDNLLLHLFKTRVLNDSGFWVDKFIPFNNEKLLLTPNAYKENKIYSALPSDGSGDFTFIRNSSATYIEDGVIKTVQPNVPRIQDGKILIEGQDTNLNLYSEDFTNSYWHKSNIDMVLSTELAPNGIDYAYKFIPTTLTHYHYLRAANAGDLSSTGILFSFYIKPSGYNWVRYFNQIAGLGVDIDILNETYTNKSGEIGQVIVKPSVNGWYRVSVEYIGIRTFTWNCISPMDNAKGGNQYMGDGVSGAFIWGAQLESRLGVPSSYIPTDGTAVTRLADIATVTPPTGITEIIETIDGVDNTITTIPPTYQLPNGEINKVIMQ